MHKRRKRNFSWSGFNQKQSEQSPERQVETNKGKTDLYQVVFMMHVTWKWMGKEDGIDGKRYRRALHLLYPRVNFGWGSLFPLAIDTKEEKLEIVGRLITFF